MDHAININSNALRSVSDASANGESMRKRKEWTKQHLEFFDKVGIGYIRDDVRKLCNEEVFIGEEGHDPAPSEDRKI